MAATARSWLGFQLARRRLSAKPYYSARYSTSSYGPKLHREIGVEDEEVPSSGISRPLSHILKDLSKKVPQSLIRLHAESSPPAKYIPWHTLNRILNLHAPEWSGEVRSITYSTDGKSVSVVYRITLYGTDAEIFREATGTAYVDEGDPVQEAETKAFGRACARFGLGLHLFHQDS
ncbi:hypothetical protein PHJA_002723000 [Phtheirospermum japonicum]|uniref:Cobalt ion binding protein n=1 Tax=Phtheirospermum japonicum TaxID=374723 RepID=A0A830D7L5_9LAMI|nr:hypothetical protein PHJA_002723000 [Phtheirospermum japonicum]